MSASHRGVEWEKRSIELFPEGEGKKGKLHDVGVASELVIRKKHRASKARNS